MKCHTIVAKGKIQDIGFRSRVEHIGRGYDLRGQVQNEKDGSVRTIFGGEDIEVDAFINIIKKMIVGNNGTTDNIVEDTNLPLDRYNYLPYPFGKVHTDDDEDLGRKLDKANNLLECVVNNTSTLVEGQNKMIEIQNKLVEGQNRLVDGQIKIVEVQNKILNTLERMEEKL